MLIGEENEEYESQDEEYATVEVSWDAVMLGGYTSDVYCHLSYFTVEDNELIFQLSKELPPTQPLPVWLSETGMLDWNTFSL